MKRWRAARMRRGAERLRGDAQQHQERAREHIASADRESKAARDCLTRADDLDGQAEQLDPVRGPRP